MLLKRVWFGRWKGGFGEGEGKREVLVVYGLSSKNLGERFR